VSKVTCQECGLAKAKRTCEIKNGIQICPSCCAKLRSPVCEDCSYYEASVRYEMGKPTKEQKKRDFITLIDPNIDEQCDKALSLVESGQIVQAEKLMSELLRKYPYYHTVQYGMGVCCVFQEKLEEGIRFFKKAVDIFPYFTEAHFNMAMAYSRLGEVGETVKAFKEVIRVGGDEELVSEAKKRVEDLERMVKKNHGFDLDTYLRNNETFNKAFAALQETEFDLAVDLFAKVLSVDPKNVQSWGNLGLAYAGLGQRAKALECLDRALELDSKYELAIANKMFVEKMEEGECLKGKVECVNYYRDYGSKKKSYLGEMVDDLKGSLKRS
jgi:tetratricopeptide (TPR) repeat protein